MKNNIWPKNNKDLFSGRLVFKKIDDDVSEVYMDSADSDHYLSTVDVVTEAFWFIANENLEYVFYCENNIVEGETIDDPNYEERCDRLNEYELQLAASIGLIHLDEE